MGVEGSRPVVLVVEDDPIISLDTSMTLEEFGCVHVEAAYTVEEAEEFLDRVTPALVVMDIDLHGSVSFSVAERLQRMGVPFILTTGHGAELAIPDALRGIPIVGKPYDLEELRAAVMPFIPVSPPVAMSSSHTSDQVV